VSRIRSYIVAFVLIFSLSESALSEYAWAEGSTRNSFTARVLSFSGNISELVEGSVDGSTKTFRSLTKPVRLTVGVPGLGRVKVVLTQKRFSNAEKVIVDGQKAIKDDETVVLLQGRIYTDEGEEPVAGAVFNVNGTPVLEISFIGRTKRRSEGTFIRIAVPLVGNPTTGKIYRVRKYALQGKTCGVKGHHAQGEAGRPETELAKSFPAKKGKGKKQIGKESAPITIRIVTVADQEWFKRYKKKSNVRMAAIVNEVDTLYRSQLGLSLQVASQVTLSSADGLSQNLSQEHPHLVVLSLPYSPDAALD